MSVYLYPTIEAGSPQHKDLNVQFNKVTAIGASTFASSVVVKGVGSSLQMPIFAAAPSAGLANGQIYYDSTAHHMYGYVNGIWTQLDNFKVVDEKINTNEKIVIENTEEIVDEDYKKNQFADLQIENKLLSELHKSHYCKQMLDQHTAETKKKAVTLDEFVDYFSDDTWYYMVIKGDILISSLIYEKVLKDDYGKLSDTDYFLNETCPVIYHVYDILTNVNYRRQGYGQYMINHLIQQLSDAPVFLETDYDNLTAVFLYLKCNMQIVHTYEEYKDVNSNRGEITDKETGETIQIDSGDKKINRVYLFRNNFVNDDE